MPPPLRAQKGPTRFPGKCLYLRLGDNLFLIWFYSAQFPSPAAENPAAQRVRVLTLRGITFFPFKLARSTDGCLQSEITAPPYCVLRSVFHSGFLAVRDVARDKREICELANAWQL
jgi:hypothetical protein